MQFNYNYEQVFSHPSELFKPPQHNTNT